MDAGTHGFLDGTVHAVHTAPDNNTGITWASFNPDGTKIAFCENGVSGDALYILTLADGSIGQPSGWTSSIGCSWIEWSPLGDKLAFSGINVYDFSTGNTIIAAQGGTPSWSANGSKIAYQSSMTGGGVAVVNSTGGNSTLIVKGAVRPKFRKNLLSPSP
jgi:Tol biopolymer transport system component